MLLSSMGFALMGACVKAAASHGIPLLEIVAARALVSLLLSYLDVRRKGLSVWGSNKPLLAARGVAGTLALICVYYSVTTLSLAEATVLQYTYPAFTVVLALAFLNERVNIATLVCILLSFLGVTVMVRPFTSGELVNLPLLSLVAALVGAFGSACAYVMVRKLSQTEDSSVIIFYFPLVALPIALALLGDGFILPDAQGLLLLLLVGLFTQIGQIGLTKAMAVEAAGKASAYAYFQVLFSAALGVIFFAEIPTLWTVIGGCLIITGALVNTLMGKRQASVSR